MQEQKNEAAIQEKKTMAPMTIKSMFAKDEVKGKFQEILGKRSAAFITSVLQIASQNQELSKADPVSVYQSAAVAATLDLPLNPNLGFAYIIPYNNKQKDGTWKIVAQFQIGAKGFKQLALRSGQFSTLNDTDVREGELKSYNRLTGKIEFEWIQDEKERLSKPVIGYASYFKLNNGFEKIFYMTNEELTQHGVKYSKTFKKGFGLWKDDFDAMARKTVIKLNLSKNAPLSVEMQRAVIVDQGMINDVDTEDVTYVDNDEAAIDKEQERIALLIQDAKSEQDLDAIYEHVGDGQMELFLQKKSELLKSK